MPQYSQSPEQLHLGTTSKLHAYWLIDADVIISLGLEMWYLMTQHFFYTR